MKKIFTFFLFFLLLSGAASANGLPKNFYKYDKYFVEAEKYFRVPYLLLKAIAMSENAKFNPDVESLNKNGTKDYGLMQINTIWLKRLGLDKEVVKHPKVNIFIAAKILRDLIDKYDYSWDTIGMYHSRTPKFKNRWIRRVQNNMIRIIRNDKKHTYRLQGF